MLARMMYTMNVLEPSQSSVGLNSSISLAHELFVFEGPYTKLKTHTTSNIVAILNLRFPQHPT